MIVISHEELDKDQNPKTQTVFVKDFKMDHQFVTINQQNFGVVEIFFTSELDQALDFETQDKADQVLQKLITASNPKILRIRRKITPMPALKSEESESEPKEKVHESD